MGCFWLHQNGNETGGLQRHGPRMVTLEGNAYPAVSRGSWWEPEPRVLESYSRCEERNHLSGILFKFDFLSSNLHKSPKAVSPKNRFHQTLLNYRILGEDWEPNVNCKFLYTEHWLFVKVLLRILFIVLRRPLHTRNPIPT